MDTKNIMIGDWVDGILGYMKVVRIGNTITGHRFASDDTIHETECVLDVVKPIPLTKEIMILNGFTTEVKGCDCYGKYQRPMGGYYTLIVSPNDGERKGSLTYKTDCNTTWVSRLWGIDLKYVHELQNALRACGREDLTKLADNFKVE